MALYGYVRVSTDEQNVARQLVSMREAGVPEANVFVDHASGRDLDRPEWARLMATVRRGDRILIDSLDRLGRAYDDVTTEWRRLTRGVGVSIRALDIEFFDSEAFASMGDMGTCIEDMLLSLLAYVAETERAKMLRRQAEGIAIARAAGKYRGRAKKRIDPELVGRAEAMLAEGRPKTEVARVLGVHPNTLRNMMSDGRLVA